MGQVWFVSSIKLAAQCSASIGFEKSTVVKIWWYYPQRIMTILDPNCLIRFQWNVSSLPVAPWPLGTGWPEPSTWRGSTRSGLSCATQPGPSCSPTSRASSLGFSTTSRPDSRGPGTCHTWPNSHKTWLKYKPFIFKPRAELFSISSFGHSYSDSCCFQVLR